MKNITGQYASCSKDNQSIFAFTHTQKKLDDHGGSAQNTILLTESDMTTVYSTLWSRGSMVFKSPPKRRLVIQAEIESWRHGRQEFQGYGVQRRRLGGFSVGFALRGRRAGDFEGARRKQKGSVGELRGRGARGGKGQQQRAPTPPGATHLRGADSERETERERATGWRHLESAAAAHCSDPAMPAPQSCGSGPSSSNQSAPSSSSPTNPGGFPPLLQELLVPPTCSPLPPCQHPLQQLYHTDTSISYSPVPSLCSGAYAFIRVLVYLLVLRLSTVNLHATWNKLTRATGKRRITSTSTCAPVLEAKIYVSVYVCAVPF